MEKGNSPTNINIESHSPQETEQIGEKIGQNLTIGNVLALKGPLGAGKTCLVKGIARSLGINEEITSPTYTIITEYEANPAAENGQPNQERFPFYHIDAYRLNGDEDFDALGGEDYLGGRGIAVVEWAERIEKSFSGETLKAEIIILDGNRRLIKLDAALYKGERG